MQALLYRFLRWCPGALGLLLRQKLYPRLVGNCGRGVLFGRFVDLIHPQNISLADRVIVSNYVILDGSSYEGKKQYGIEIDHDVFLGTATRLVAGNSGIVVQSGTNIGSSCKITGDLPARIGRNVLLAAYCHIGTVRQNKSALKTQETIVEDGCWLGVRADIEAGAHVQRDSIVGAHATVEGEIPAWAIATGQPAQVTRFRNV